MRASLRAASGMAAAALAVGCGPTVTSLLPPAMPESQAVVLCGPPNTPVRLKAIDGEPGPGRLGYGAGWNGAFVVKLAPGTHTLTANYWFGEMRIGYTDSGYTLDNDQTIPFEGKAGSTYVFYYKSDGQVVQPDFIDATGDPDKCSESLPMFPGKPGGDG